MQRYDNDDCVFLQPLGRSIKFLVSRFYSDIVIFYHCLVHEVLVDADVAFLKLANLVAHPLGPFLRLEYLVIHLDGLLVLIAIND